MNSPPPKTDGNCTAPASVAQTVEPSKVTEGTEHAQSSQMATITTGELKGEESSPAKKKSEEDLKLSAETKRSLQSLQGVMLFDDGGDPTELQKMVIEGAQMLKPFLKAVESGDWKDLSREERLRLFDALPTALRFLADVLQCRGFIEEHQRRVEIQRIEMLKRFFPEELPLDSVQEEERLALIESAKSRNDEIKQFKSDAIELAKSMGFDLGPNHLLLK